MIYNFTWIRPGRMAGFGLAAPDDVSAAELVGLRRRGVGALVSLSETPVRSDALAGIGLRYVHLPVPDMEPPTIDQIERFLDFAAAAAGDDLGTAVHCRAGLGRTGTMLACYLVSQGAGAEQALVEVRARRPGSIETAAQEGAVREFARSLQARQKQRA